MFKYLLAVLSTTLLLAMSPIEALKRANETSVQIGEFCSGTIISDNLVVTANHCLQRLEHTEAQNVEYPDGHIEIKWGHVYDPVVVTQNKRDAKGNVYSTAKYNMYLVQRDETYDVALFTLSEGSISFDHWATLSDKEVEYGDEVYTIGNPLMINGTIAKGNVTLPKFGNPPGTPSNIPPDAIMFDSFMAPGSSGGSLFNTEGELIGITNWGLTGGPYLASRVIHVKDLLGVYNGRIQ